MLSTNTAMLLWKCLDQFYEIEAINTQFVAHVQRGVVSQAERADMGRRIDRLRLAAVWQLLSVLLFLDDVPRNAATEIRH